MPDNFDLAVLYRFEIIKINQKRSCSVACEIKSEVLGNDGAEDNKKLLPDHFSNLVA